MRTRLAEEVYYGWVIVVACFLAAGALFGLTYSFSVFFDALAAEFAVPPARISLVFGVQTAVIYIGGVGLGRGLDRFGPRVLLAAGAVLLTGGMVVAARAETYLGLVAGYGLATGLGMGCCYVVAYATVPRWFQRRRGLATGIAAAGLGAGLLVVTPTASWLVAQVGWRGAFDALAVGLFCVLAFATYLLAAQPAAVGANRAREFVDGVETVGRDESVRKTVLSVPFLFVVLGWGGVYATLFVLVNHLVPFAGVLGVRGAGVTAISALGVGTSLARLVVGYTSDRTDRVAVFVACAALMASCLLVLPLASSAAALIAVAVVYGVGYGGTGALLSPFVADLFGVGDIGTLYGFASIAFAIAGLAAPPLATAGLGAVGDYTSVFLATGLVGLGGVAFVAAAGWTAPGGWRGRVDA
ncbi:MFS transporter [Halosegnis sp.]|uniref:MFS transporter n=1 Tax=Halosegnis sp. TaxID=2864959 RepID=UPI0035D4F7BE